MTIGTHQRDAHTAPSYVQKNTANAPIIANRIEPNSPSTDFLGEMRGDSLCLPNHAPKNRPPVSLRAGRNTSVIACATGCPLNTSDSTMQLASVGMYSTVSIETATCDSRL